MWECIVFIQLCSWNHTAYLTRNWKPLSSHLNPWLTDIVSLFFWNITDSLLTYLLVFPGFLPVCRGTLSSFSVIPWVPNSFPVFWELFDSLMDLICYPHLLFGFLPVPFRGFACFLRMTDFDLCLSQHPISFVVFLIFFLASNKYFWNHKIWPVSEFKSESPNGVFITPLIKLKMKLYHFLFFHMWLVPKKHRVQ